MFAKSSEVGIFLKTVCIAHNYYSYSEFVRRKLAIVHFHSTFSFQSAFSFQGAFILFSYSLLCSPKSSFRGTAAEHQYANILELLPR
jgi:hypothetical protein